MIEYTWMFALLTSNDRRTFCKITVTSRWHCPRDDRRRDIVFSSCSFARKLLPNIRNRIFLGYDPSHERERGSTSIIFFLFPSLIPAAPLLDIPRRHTPRVARVMWHVSNRRRRIMHVSHARYVTAAVLHRHVTVAAAAAAASSRIPADCTFSFCVDDRVDAIDQHRIFKPHRYLSLMPRTCGEVIPRYNISRSKFWNLC